LTQRREDNQEPLRLHWEERLGMGEPGQAVPTEGVETDAGGQGVLDSSSGLVGDHDLAAMRRRTDTGRGVDGQPDVPRIGEGGAAAVDTGADLYLEVLGPGPRAQRALDDHGRFDGRNDALEDGEELIRAGVDLTAAGAAHRGPNDVLDVFQQVRVAIAELPEKNGGALDVGEQEGDESAGERGWGGRMCALGPQLAGDEPDGHDAMLLRGVQQPLAGALSGRVVLEGDLLE